MMDFTLSALAKISNGTLYGEDLTLNTISTDTRNMTKNSLFVALIGKRFDAHDFIDYAIKKGALGFLINKHFPIPFPQIIVQDTRVALGKIATWVRKQLNTRIIAITGSSGKTTVKEMTATVLRQCGETLCNLENLNNDLGVSMTLLRLTKKHKYAVIEIGCSKYGEINYVSNLTQPESALINNLSPSHLKGLNSLHGIAKEKGNIFKNLTYKGTGIINADSNDWLNWKKNLEKKTIWSFSIQNNFSDFFANEISMNKNSSQFTIHTPKGKIKIKLSLPGLHNISNALATTALAISVGAPLSSIQSGLEAFQAIPGRLFLIQLKKNQFLLDDTYNANVGSVAAAIKTLTQMPGYRVMVIGDMDELGNKTEKYHTEIGLMIKNTDIDNIFSIGKFSHLITKTSALGKHVKNKDMLVKQLINLLFEHPKITILIKGSRSARMEEIVNKLKEVKKCYSG